MERPAERGQAEPRQPAGATYQPNQERGPKRAMCSAGLLARFERLQNGPGGGDYGALRLMLSPRMARFASVAADGRILDSGKVACRRAKG